MNDKLRKYKFYNQISPKSKWKTYHNQTYKDYWNKKRNEPITNEKWFCGLNTEEKADFFCTVQHCLTIYGDHIATIEDWKKWLKENHNG